MNALPPDPSGPVFISYRWSDGTDLAKDVARRLRASGVPVWLDREDMPPGELGARLRQALQSGLSGAILVATPNVAHRKVPDAIHDIETPTIFDDLGKHDAFTIAVVNTGLTESGEIDRDAPSAWYGRLDAQGYRQFCPADETIESLGESMARERLGKMRSRREDSILTIDLQTRVSATSFNHSADLVFRTIPPVNGRVPSRLAFEDLRAFLAWLPHAVAAEATREVRLVGGAHLSVACAVGAALPETSGIPLAVQSTDDGLWRLNARPSAKVASSVKIRKLRPHGAGPDVAVLVDLVPTDAMPTFDEHLHAHTEEFGRAYVIRSAIRVGPDTAGSTAREVVDVLHYIAAEAQAELHLFLRTPWGSAALIGALLNTLSATLYEWDNTQSPARYVPTITITPGLAEGPLTHIHL